MSIDNQLEADNLKEGRITDPYPEEARIFGISSGYRSTYWSCYVPYKDTPAAPASINDIIAAQNQNF
ncbi:hypothetical protein GCM10023187_52000 [Nibrella viscosa]|uniref:Uncharacterized protein n=1 Tax=Nibrella viscosa TaxID=1084524 RepID=A0ABP8KZ71_9BACT